MAQFSKFRKYFNDEQWAILKKFQVYKVRISYNAGERENRHYEGAEFNLRDAKQFQEKYPELYKRLEYLTKHFYSLTNKDGRDPIMILQHSIAVSIYSGDSAPERLGLQVNLEALDMKFKEFEKKCKK